MLQADKACFPSGLSWQEPWVGGEGLIQLSGQNLDVLLGSSVGTLGSQFLQLVQGRVNVEGIQILFREPLVCRAWGILEGWSCPQGCVWGRGVWGQGAWFSGQCKSKT